MLARKIYDLLSQHASKSFLNMITSARANDKKIKTFCVKNVLTIGLVLTTHLHKVASGIMSSRISAYAISIENRKIAHKVFL